MHRSECGPEVRHRICTSAENADARELLEECVAITEYSGGSRQHKLAPVVVEWDKPVS
jgi:hypothetical protein